MPIALAVFGSDDSSSDILQCGVRFNLKSTDAKGASGNKVLLNELPEIPVRTESIRFKRTRPKRRTPVSGTLTGVLLLGRVRLADESKEGL